MLIDSLIIKLIREGAGIGPDDRLTIYGDGKVIYEGVENVEVKDVVESSIDNDKIVSLVLKFKELGFFSLNDIFSVEDSIDRPSTIISFSIPKETGEMITKSIKYYHGDKRVPKELKILENNIEEIVGSSKWVGELSESEGFEVKKPTSISKDSVEVKKEKAPFFMDTKSRKYIVIGIFIIIITAIILLGLYSGFIDISLKETDQSNEVIINNDIPLITYITPAQNVNGFRDYDEIIYFEPSDTIYIYLEYSNITSKENSKFDIKIDVTIINNGKTYYSESVYESTLNNYSILEIITNESWLKGEYLVDIIVYDNLSQKNDRTQISFTLVEKSIENPEITVFLTASDVRGYQDYDKEIVFYLNEIIYIYQEYTNITIINISECNINLIFNVFKDEVIVYSDHSIKYEVGNNAHYWYFTPNVNWTTGMYTARVQLKDNITNKITSKTFVFTFVNI